MHIPINHLRKLFAKWLSLLLQIGGPLIITKRVRFITKRDSYYHLMQIFYKSRQLLQIVHNYFNVKKDTTCIVDLLRNLFFFNDCFHNLMLQEWVVKHRNIMYFYYCINFSPCPSQISVNFSQWLWGFIFGR